MTRMRLLCQKERGLKIGVRVRVEVMVRVGVRKL